MIDISNLNNKTQNKGADESGRLAASEWNTLVSAVEELQDESYVKPAAGIPTADITDANLSMTQAEINQRTNEALASKQDTLVSGQNIKTVGGQSIVGNGDIDVSDEDAVKFISQQLTDQQKTQARTNIGAYKKPTSGIPSTDMASDVRTSLGKADTAYQKPQSGIPASDIEQGVIPDISGKQDTIQDLSAIRSGAAAGATAYQKPSGGIPVSDIVPGAIPSISTDVSADALSDTKTSSPKSVKTYVDGNISPIRASVESTDLEVEQLKSAVASVDRGEFVEAWDGASTPVVADIPAGVTVTYSSTSYTGELVASASTSDKIYLVSKGSNDEYDRYITSRSGSEGSYTYSWSKLGSTEITLSNYMTNERFVQFQDSINTDILGNKIADKTVTVSGQTTTDTGIDLVSGKTYRIYVQCSTAAVHSNSGVWVKEGTTFTEIQRLSPAEWETGAYIEYPAPANVDLFVRPFSSGSVVLKVWDEDIPATIKQLKEGLDGDGITLAAHGERLTGLEGGIATLSEKVEYDGYRYNKIEPDDIIRFTYISNQNGNLTTTGSDTYRLFRYDVQEIDNLFLLSHNTLGYRPCQLYAFYNSEDTFDSTTAVEVGPVVTGNLDDVLTELTVPSGAKTLLVQELRPNFVQEVSIRTQVNDSMKLRINDLETSTDELVDSSFAQKTVITDGERFIVNLSEIDSYIGDTVDIYFRYLSPEQRSAVGIYPANDRSSSAPLTITWLDAIHARITIAGTNPKYLIFNGVRANVTVTVVGKPIANVSGRTEINAEKIAKLDDAVFPTKYIADFSGYEVGATTAKYNKECNIKAGVRYSIRVTPFSKENTLYFVTYNSGGNIVGETITIKSEITLFDRNEDCAFLLFFTNLLNVPTKYYLELYDENSLPRIKDDTRSLQFGDGAAPVSLYEDKLEALDAQKIQQPVISLSAVDPYVISIDNQQDFDGVNAALSAAITGGHKNISIEISEGDYFHGSTDGQVFESWMNLNSVSDPNLCISIRGEGKVRIIGANKSYTISEGTPTGGGYYKVSLKSSVFNPTKNYLDDKGNIHTLVKDAEYMMGAITEVDASERKYKFKTDHVDMTAEECADMWVLTSHGWILCCWKVDKIEDGEIYISGNDQCDTVITPNYLGLDTRNTGMLPRYKLINEPGGEIYVLDGYIYIPRSINTLYECDDAGLINISGCSIKHFEISNLEIVGGANTLNETYFYGSARASTYVIKIDESLFSNYFEIFNCVIRGRARTLVASSTPNLYVHDNKFEDCSPGCIYTQHIAEGTPSRNIYIARNEFVRCRAVHRETFTLEVKSDGLNIYDNRFINCMSYSILTGISRTFSVTPNDCSGIIERNLFLNDRDGIKDQHNNIQDGGQIYIDTRTSGIIIRHNVFFTPIGEYSINAIYLDWGAKNVSIYKNLIAGVDSGHDVNARAADATFPTDVAPYVPDYSCHNLMLYNVMTGTYRFEGQSDEDGDNTKGVNALLRFRNEYSNAASGNQYVEPDMKYPLLGMDDNTISMRNNDFRALRNFGLSAFVLKHIRHFN